MLNIEPLFSLVLDELEKKITSTSVAIFVNNYFKSHVEFMSKKDLSC